MAVDLKTYIGNNQVTSIDLHYEGVDVSVSEASFTKPKAFEDYTWAEIKAICQAGTASQYFHIGDEKPLKDNAGNDYIVRVADMKTGRYKYVSDNSPTHVTFEIENCWCQDSGTNINYGEIMCYNISRNNYFPDLNNLFEDIYIYKMNTGGGQSTDPPTLNQVTLDTVRLFMPSVAEICTQAELKALTVYPYVPAVMETTSTYDDSTQMEEFDFYHQSANIIEARKKHRRLTSSSYCTYVTRTLRDTSSGYWMDFTIDALGQIYYQRHDRETAFLAMCFVW